MYEDMFRRSMIAGETVPFTLPEWIARAPFEEYLGMTIVEARDGRAVLVMPFQVRHAQGKGLMHGGAVTALADTAVAMAIKSFLPEGSHFVTTECCLKFQAPIQGGQVRAVASARFLDDRNIEGVAEVVREDGVTAATFTARFRVKKQE